jgi:murein DD-endopeptidase MepM/ murein hydrolase activator NlpD
LVFAGGFGGKIIRNKKTAAFSVVENSAIVSDRPSVATEESELLKTTAQTYLVLEGDSLEGIARRFHLTLDALAFANKINDPFSYQPKTGKILDIPPIEGLVYKVRSGDTLESIARLYQTEPIHIVEFNYLFPPYKLEAGRRLVVPFARVPSSGLSGGLLGGVETPSGSCGALSLAWPNKSHQIVGSYGCYFSSTHNSYICHQAIDFGADYEPLYAVADGTVVAAGSFAGRCFSFTRECNYGYGGYLFVDIGKGYQVRYAHISEPTVGVGQKVTKGQVVAISGETGYAFGPHLHLELLCNGKKVNPLPYIK